MKSHMCIVYLDLYTGCILLLLIINGVERLKQTSWCCKPPLYWVIHVLDLKSCALSISRLSLK